MCVLCKICVKNKRTPIALIHGSDSQWLNCMYVCNSEYGGDVITKKVMQLGPEDHRV